MLELEQVVKKYHRYTALKGLTCTVERGQVVGLLGANGAGKSTAMNMIAGYFAPTSGRILWNGTDVRKLGPAYQNEVGYLPEVPPLHPELTVRESMEYVCGLRGIRLGKRRKLVERQPHAALVGIKEVQPAGERGLAHFRRIGALRMPALARFSS